MPQTFAIQGVAVPLIGTNYFAQDLSSQGGISNAELIDRIVSLGANEVRLIGSYGQLSDPSGNTYSPFTTQSVESLRLFTDLAHARGLTISWNPITHFANGVIAGDNTQDSHLNPTDPAAWFASWRLSVLENARIAEAIGAERFLILSDIEQFAFVRNPDLADEMVALIGEVRGIYRGTITSNLWTPDGDLDDFPFAILQALDLLGVALFPKLTNSTTPTLEELEAAFHSDVNGVNILKNLAELAAETGKHIWFADFAQSSYDGWLRDNPQKFDSTATFTPDNSEQVLGYQAFMNTMMKYGWPWFEGLSVQNISRVDNYTDNKPAYFSGPAAETFWGKPGEQVLRDYFTGAVDQPAVELRGSNYGETVTGASFGPMSLYAGQANQTLTGGAKADTFYAAAVGGNVAVHELKFTLVGQSAQGEMPAFAVRVNGQTIPLEYQIATGFGAPATVYTIPIFTTAPITSIELITTNWIAGANYNRYIQVDHVSLDGVTLTSGVYHPSHGPAEAFTGHTNRGGYVAWNTSGQTFTPTGTVDLAANTTMDGGAGIDTVVYAGDAAQFTITQTASGWQVLKPGASASTGRDGLANIEVLRFNDMSVWVGASLDASAATGGQTINLALGQVSSVTLNGAAMTLVSQTDGGEARGGAGDDVIRTGARGSQLYGGAGHDTIEGGAGLDYLRGEAGDDVIYGGGGFDDAHGNMGNDSVHGGGGGDWVVGGQGNDLLFGDDGHDVVYGNLGNDTAHGGDDNDWVRGGQGEDSLTGGAGDDWMSGDRGNDTLAGGAGADIFNVFGGAGIDRVLDFNRAEGDRVKVEPGYTYAVEQVGADVVVNVSGGAQIILVGVQLATLSDGWIFTG